MVFRNTCDRQDVGCQKDIEGSTFLLIRHILFFVGIFYNMILYVGESLTKVKDGNKIQPRKKAINWKSFKSIKNNATVKKVWNIVKCITVGLFCFAAPIIRACYQFANNDKAKNDKDIRSWSPVSLVKAPSRTKGSTVAEYGIWAVMILKTRFSEVVRQETFTRTICKCFREKKNFKKKISIFLFPQGEPYVNCQK